MGALFIVHHGTCVHVDARACTHYRGNINNVPENHAWLGRRRVDRVFCWRALSGARAEGGHCVMSQSSVIFGALFIGFIVFVVMKGEISAYAKVFTG